MKRSINFPKPMFALAAASLVMVAFVTADFAQAQTAGAQTATVSSAKADLKVGTIAYVSSDVLNLRSKPSLSSDVVVAQLSRNDQVQILDLLDASSSLVKIKIVKSDTASNSSAAELYVSAEYLTSSAAPGASGSGLSKYFVIQNVATEKMRVYERCTTAPGCANKMVFETDMVVGRPEGAKGDKYAYVTWLGRYKITDWVKFYQDGAQNYPSWYDPAMPATPKAGSGGGAWLSKKVMPAGSKAEMRGAFGWYAAMTAPNSNNQWIHGTIGWGSDGDKFIRMTRSFWLNLIADPRSHGCTRLENRAIAYSRHLLPVGTEIFRVYAREALRDVSRAAYQAQNQPVAWEFILTKEGVRKSGGATSDKNSVLARGVSEDLILERGSYGVDKYPTGAPLTGKSASSGKSGNTYDIKQANFRGVLLIDDGTFVDYQHPAGLPVGGFADRSIPASLQGSAAAGYTVVSKNIK